MAEEQDRRSLWQRIAGDGSHLGFWTLPVFVATALGGAVIAGALAQVYYGQQVAQLEEESAAARAAAEVAAEEIETARQEALAAIDEQVDGVRDALEVARPLDDPATAGIVALEVEVVVSTPSGAGSANGAPADDPSPDASPTPRPAPPPPTTRTRRAVGFVVAVDGGTSFVATSFGAVADPATADGVASAVTVSGPTGSARGTVHAWDEERGVAVVRVDLTDLPVLPWRPEEPGLSQGDVVVLAAVTPGLVGVQLPGRVGAVTDRVLVTDLPIDPVYDGAPLVDGVGRVVALQASTSSPFGPGSSGAITVRQLCVELVDGCDLLVEADPSDQADASA